MPFLRGTVVDNQDPMKRGRVRVWVWGIHFEPEKISGKATPGYHPKNEKPEGWENLPWAEVMGDTTDPLHQGKGKKPEEFPLDATVWVEFEAGDLNCPVVVGVYVGHEAGDDMQAANPGNSDWMMAGGGGGGGLGGMLGGALGGMLGGMIGGPLGGVLGPVLGDIIGGAMTPEQMQEIVGILGGMPPGTVPGWPPPGGVPPIPGGP